RRLLTGRGRYVDDVHVEGLLHAAIVRSPHAHARIRAIDARAARRLPGVVAVLTARDLPECAAGVPPLVPSAAMRAYHHAAIAGALGLGESRVRVLAPDVGGGFGIKGHPYAEEVLIAVVARRLGRPVKWIETRREHFLTAAPDRDQRHRARLGARRDGTLTAI